jgi:hypothetical protein
MKKTKPETPDFESITSQAIEAFSGTEGLLTHMKKKNCFSISKENATIWFFADWNHVEITTSSHVLTLYPNMEYEIDYIKSPDRSRRRREEEGHIPPNNVLSVLLSLICSHSNQTETEIKGRTND